MAGRDDAARAERKPRIGLTDRVRIRNRIDLIHALQFRVATKRHFFSAANNVQVPDVDVISNGQPADAHYDVEMADLNIIFDRAPPGIDEAEADAYALTDAIPKEEAI